MKIQLTGWETKGLRCADMNVSLLKNNKVPKIAFIQMHNGTGKTTLLKLIRAALDGEARYWDKSEIRDLKPNPELSYLKNTKKINSENGSFKLELLVNDKPIIFSIVFDFETNEVKYTTQSPLTGGLISGWNPPSNIQLFLQKKFVSLYIFDGELAKDLLSSNQTRAKEAIETLSQLDLFDQLAIDLDKYWEKIKNEAPTSGSSQGQKTKLDNKINACDIRLKELKSSMSKKTKLLVEEKNKYEALNKKIEEALKRNSGLADEKSRITDRINKANINLNSNTETFLNTLRNPQSIFSGFKDHLIEFKNNLDLAQLPEKSSRQFFIDLSKKEKCVCGRNITEKEAAHIIGHADEYLSTEISSIINQIKGDIENLVINETGEEVFFNKENLKRSINESAEADTEYTNFEIKLKSIKGEDYQTWIEERTLLSESIKQLNREIDELDAPYSLDSVDLPLDNIFSIKTIEVIKKSLSAERANLSGLLTTKNKIEKLHIIFSQAKELAKEQLNLYLLNKCNEKITEVLVQNPLTIESIEDKINLKGQGGASEGQGLAIAYIFLSVALNKGSNQFPLLVDSPTGKLDEVVRANIAKIIPHLTEQFITFITPTEKSHFVEAIKKESKDITYHTIFRKTPLSEKAIKDYSGSNIVINDDSVHIIDEDYFDKFSLREE